MEITEKYGLVLDGEDDYYDISRANANLKALEDAVLGTGLSEARVMTKGAFSELAEKDSQALYIVTEEKGFTLYFGELPLKASASEPDNAVRLVINAVPDLSVVGTAKHEEV